MIKDVAKVVETLGLGSDKLVVIDDEASKCLEAGSLSAHCLIVPALAGVESDDQVTMLLDIVAGLEAIAGHTGGSAQEAMAAAVNTVTKRKSALVYEPYNVKPLHIFDPAQFSSVGDGTVYELATPHSAARIESVVLAAELASGRLSPLSQ